MNNDRKSIVILGTRGIPARHGGFETFAERLALWLVSGGWDVVVYCQSDGSSTIRSSHWRGVTLLHVPAQGSGALSTIIFDLKSILHGVGREAIFLTLGYNTAILCLWLRLRGEINIINMDGLEWRRNKWSCVARMWLWINERMGCWVGNHLIADHPRIADHLSTRVARKKVTMIPYGADEVTSADSSHLELYDLRPRRYSVIISRPEPENSIFEMVAAFSRRRRNHTLVVLGDFQPDSNYFHRCVTDVASDEVIFPGAIYDQELVKALRFYACFYLHGHTVGGTNPSLVEAMGAGCAVIAHDNEFNRWVVGDGAVYFGGEDECAALFDLMLEDSDQIAELGRASLRRFRERFTWDRVLQEYEELLDEWYPTD